jgi:hypothetical protein
MVWPAVQHILALAFFGAVIVATPLPLNFAALFVWAWIVWKWSASWSRENPDGWVNGPVVVQLCGMSAIVLAAVFAPVKVVASQKAQQITLPKVELTVAELAEPIEHGMDRFHRFAVNAPDELAYQSVKFPARELSVAQFIAAIESQTPLRHRYHHCGNGLTILWGGDCSFGLHFRVPGNL